MKKVEGGGNPQQQNADNHISAPQGTKFFLAENASAAILRWLAARGR